MILMPTLPELRARIQRKLQAMGGPADAAEVARIYHLIAGLASDPQAMDLRMSAKPMHLATVETMLALVTETFAQEIALYRAESDRLIQRHFATDMGGRGTIKDLTHWWMGEQVRLFNGLSFEDAW
jgi:hypothetical protein